MQSRNVTPCRLVIDSLRIYSVSMAGLLLRFGLWGLGLSAIVIGSALALLGPDAVANFFAAGLAYIFNATPIADLSTPNIESELRFFGIMFVFFGGVLIQTVRQLDLYYARVPILLAVFFLAGLARVKGYLEVGEPHALFIGLMAIEIGLPIFLIILWKLRKATLPQP